MPSPVVDFVREIPLVVERDYPMDCDDAGFPFDDDREEGNADFRSQLDDIAARHPQFAHHLGSFPFRSGARQRAQIPEEFSQHFTERPFPDRFERFGFPFDEAEQENKPYYQRYPQYYPQDVQENQDHQPSSSGEEQQATEPVNEEEGEREEPERGRKLKNIQQSNTVDLGQRQEPVNDRNQRSMSAPPPNNRQRFVSSINIPVNQPTENSNNPQNMHQPSAPPQPQERVIPIHVEGRDEPILPKKSSASTSQPQSHQQQPQPSNDKFFTQKSPNFSQYFNRDPNFQGNWFPKTFQNKQPQPQTGFNQSQQRGRSPQPQSKQEESTHEHINVPEQHQTDNQPKQMPTRPDPIDQIKSIQKDVSQLMAEVDKFNGKPKDKTYLYLDEMLTRNLIKLDNIDTQGQENIRSARKEAIKCIEKCIGILESKANLNAEEKNNTQESKEMEVQNIEEKQETNDTSKNEDVECLPENKQNVDVTEKTVDQKMVVDAEKSDVSSTHEQPQNNETTQEEKMEILESNQDKQINTEKPQINKEEKDVDNTEKPQPTEGVKPEEKEEKKD